METKTDYSYGVIPFFKEDGAWKVFLINQYGSAGDVYWTFPKGHAENEESPMEAALRELYEETGITVKQLEEKTYSQEYSFMHENEVINKVVIYYVGFASSFDFVIQQSEVKEAGWFDLEEARKLITFDKAKALFDEVAKELPA